MSWLTSPRQMNLCSSWPKGECGSWWIPGGWLPEAGFGRHAKGPGPPVTGFVGFPAIFPAEDPPNAIPDRLSAAVLQLIASVVIAASFSVANGAVGSGVVAVAIGHRTPVNGIWGVLKVEGQIYIIYAVKVKGRADVWVPGAGRSKTW